VVSSIVTCREKPHAKESLSVGQKILRHLDQELELTATKLEGRYTKVTSVITRMDVVSSAADLLSINICCDIFVVVPWFFSPTVSFIYVAN
jgi:hypothetical protein